MTDKPKSVPDAPENSTDDRSKQTAALLRILAMDSHDIALGNFCDAGQFFAELDREDEETGDSTSDQLDPA
jgi:hypothetical protein